jgi:hypothetical protein
LSRPTDELSFMYQGIKRLARQMDKPKVRYQGINPLIRPKDKLKVQGLITKLVNIGHK